MTKEQIIDETVQYYEEDVTRRAYNEDEGACDYWHKGNMCAVGRCLINPKKFSKRFPLSTGNTDIIEISDYVKTLTPFFKPKYRGHRVAFWKDLQKLHDTDAFWIGTQSKRERREMVDILKDKWCEKVE